MDRPFWNCRPDSCFVHLFGVEVVPTGRGERMVGLGKQEDG